MSKQGKAIDFSKPLQCDKGFVYIIAITNGAFRVGLGKIQGVSCISYEIFQNGKAPEILGSEFDVRNFDGA